jgi:hypothetical protein
MDEVGDAPPCFGPCPCLAPLLTTPAPRPFGLPRLPLCDTGQLHQRLQPALMPAASLGGPHILELLR